jgi:hypothetical protein
LILVQVLDFACKISYKQLKHRNYEIQVHYFTSRQIKEII